MQSPRRSNRERSASTRAALIDAARGLFIEKGFGDTGTPEITAAAGVTRGALYHHFADKKALFRAVVEREARDVAAQIERGSASAVSTVTALFDGAHAFFDAMNNPGRIRLLLVEGPAVLGHAEMARIDSDTGGDTLRQGLAAGIANDELKDMPLEAATTILSAVFDRAALAIAAGESEKDYTAVIRFLIGGLIR